MPRTLLRIKRSERERVAACSTIGPPLPGLIQAGKRVVSPPAQELHLQIKQTLPVIGIAAEAIDAQLQRLGHCPLGHLSAGTDRHGGEFLSVYGEIRPL